MATENVTCFKAYTTAMHNSCGCTRGSRENEKFERVATAGNNTKANCETCVRSKELRQKGRQEQSVCSENVSCSTKIMCFFRLHLHHTSLFAVLSESFVALIYMYTLHTRSGDATYCSLFSSF